MMRGGTLLILGHGFKGQGQLWHSVYNALWAQYRLQFKFKLHMSVVDDEGRNPIEFGSQGQRSSSILPTYEGMPCFALSSLFYTDIVFPFCGPDSLYLSIFHRNNPELNRQS